jgi:hypothetical protein
MLTTDTKKINVKSISVQGFRKTLLEGAKALLSEQNCFKGSTKELSGRR